MIFNSLAFVVFFAAVLVLHSLPFSWQVKKINLLLASYVFYAAWNPPFVILLWLSAVVDWFAARGLAQAEQPWKRRAWMLLSVVGDSRILFDSDLARTEQLTGVRPVQLALERSSAAAPAARRTDATVRAGLHQAVAGESSPGEDR